MLRIFVFLCLFFVAANQAHSHALGVSFLHLLQSDEQTFTLHWVPSKELTGAFNPVNIQFPPQCELDQTAQQLQCTQPGLKGSFGFDALPFHAEVVVHAQFLDATQFTKVVTGAQPTLVIGASGNLALSWLNNAKTYLVIGIEHILLGIDHLLFVLGLLMLVGFNKKLLWTITVFTLAHSMTLALSVLGHIRLAQLPVEIVIALSILLVAREALNPRLTLARRFPWALAFVFGLVHGLGFAGALRDVGLPENAIPQSLVAFNVGVELGQLAVLGVVWVLVQVFHKARHLTPLQAIKINHWGFISCAYGVGCMGAYWSLERGAVLLGL